MHWGTLKFANTNDSTNYLLYLIMELVMRCVARWQIKLFKKKVIFVTAN